MDAHAFASAGGHAQATATVTGIFQNMNGTLSNTVIVNNSGTFLATASATAVGASGSAFAKRYRRRHR